MGCEPTKEQNKQIIFLTSQQQFKLSYRELISQDRGHVFDLYKFCEVLSRSNHSIIRKVKSQATHQSRVCKIVPLVKKQCFTDIHQTEYLKKLDHPNIVQVIQYFLQPSFLYVILEDIPGGRILTQFYNHKNGILFDDVIEIMKQLLMAVDFCHRKMIAHRAITSQNILLYWNQERKPCVKLIDFSQACAINGPIIHPISQGKRNVVLKDKQNNETEKVDIYDCGIVLYSLLSGKRILSLNNEINYKKILQDSIQTIKQIRLGKKIEKEAINLLSLMLAEDPRARPSAADCLSHGFFKSLNKAMASSKAIDNLISFKVESNLRYLLSMYASQNMTSVMEKAQYLTEFYNLDKNKDGQIQMDELVEGIINNYHFQEDKAREHAQQIFANLDKNKSGSINFSQFITGTTHISKLVSNEFLLKVFKQLDTNHDGYVSEKQINSVLAGMTKCKLMQEKKSLNFSQFKDIMMQMMEDEKKKYIE